MERPTKVEQKSDFVGAYTVYTYADGHTETDPPRRPMSREDVQRLRMVQFSKENPTKAATVASDHSLVMSRSLLLQNYNDTQAALSTAVDTIKPTVSAVADLVGTINTGSDT